MNTTALRINDVIRAQPFWKPGLAIDQRPAPKTKKRPAGLMVRLNQWTDDTWNACAVALIAAGFEVERVPAPTKRGERFLVVL